MINKIKSLSKKQWLMIAGALLLVVALVVTICLVCNRPSEGEIKLESIKDIEITAEDKIMDRSLVYLYLRCSG